MCWLRYQRPRDTDVEVGGQGIAVRAGGERSKGQSNQVQKPKLGDFRSWDQDLS